MTKNAVESILYFFGNIKLLSVTSYVANELYRVSFKNTVERHTSGNNCK